MFEEGYWIRPQLTLDLSPHSQPDPDIAVIAGSSDTPSVDLPTTALLIIEVSDTTLSTDRKRKASLYAYTGIVDYWIVNLRDDCLEVSREPRPGSTAEFGHEYTTLATFRPGEFVTPLAAPQARIAVAELFPK